MSTPPNFSWALVPYAQLCLESRCCGCLSALEETRLENGGVYNTSPGVSRVLTAGVHRFNFSHVLPTSLPSSFESHIDHHSRRRVQHQQQQQRKDELRIKVHCISGPTLLQWRI